MKSIRISLIALVCLAIVDQAFAQKDTAFKRYKSLPLKASRMFDLNTTEGTWTSVDISPDGKTIVTTSQGREMVGGYSVGLYRDAAR